MSKSASKTDDIGQLLAELEAVVAWFESDEVDIARAVKKYEQGLGAIKQLEKLLAKAKLQVEHIDKSFES